MLPGIYRATQNLYFFNCLFDGAHTILAVGAYFFIPDMVILSPSKEATTLLLFRSTPRAAAQGFGIESLKPTEPEPPLLAIKLSSLVSIFFSFIPSNSPYLIIYSGAAFRHGYKHFHHVRQSFCASFHFVTVCFHIGLLLVKFDAGHFIGAAVVDIHIIFEIFQGFRFGIAISRTYHVFAFVAFIIYGIFFHFLNPFFSSFFP